MKEPISVFIMDVSNSSSENNWDELTNYLKKWESTLNSLKTKERLIKVKHRMGDEILLVSTGFSIAYMTAFFIGLLWKYDKQRPYFGISLGYSEISKEMMDIDTWNHPMIKKARLANEKIKNDNNRSLDIYFSSYENIGNNNRFDKLLNVLSHVQSKLLQDQTKHQRLICSLYSIFEEQKIIGKILSKTSATISSHYRKGNCELIFKTFETIIEILDDLENSTENEIQSIISKEFKNSFRKTVKADPSDFFFNLDFKKYLSN